MGIVTALGRMAVGAAAGVALVTALPLFGAVGTVTALGLTVGSLIGAAGGVVDEVRSNKANGVPPKPPRAIRRRKPPNGPPGT